MTKLIIDFGDDDMEDGNCDNKQQCEPLMTLMTIDNNTGEQTSDRKIPRRMMYGYIDASLFTNHLSHSWEWDDHDDDEDDNDNDDDDDDDYINDDKQNHDEVLKAKRCPCKTRLYSAKSFYELFRHIWSR